MKCLERARYRLDSSVLPGRRMRRWVFGAVYDFRGAPNSPYHASIADVRGHGASPILEIPVSENPLMRGTPIGGGFLNTYGPEKTVDAVRKVEGSAVVLVFHPWEFVDLASKFPGLPKWMLAGCRSDLSPLSEFLASLKTDEWEFLTLGQVAKSYQRTQAGS